MFECLNLKVIGCYLHTFFSYSDYNCSSPTPSSSSLLSLPSRSTPFCSLLENRHLRNNKINKKETNWNRTKQPNQRENTRNTFLLPTRSSSFSHLIIPNCLFPFPDKICLSPSPVLLNKPLVLRL